LSDKSLRFSNGDGVIPRPFSSTMKTSTPANRDFTTQLRCLQLSATHCAINGQRPTAKGKQRDAQLHSSLLSDFARIRRPLAVKPERLVRKPGADRLASATRDGNFVDESQSSTSWYQLTSYIATKLFRSNFLWPLFAQCPVLFRELPGRGFSGYHWTTIFSVPNTHRHAS